MKITILDDYHDTVRSLACFRKLDGHDVTVWHDHTQDIDVLAERLADTEALVLIRERTHIRTPLLARLPKLKLITSAASIPTSISRPARGKASSYRRTSTPARRPTPPPS